MTLRQLGVLLLIVTALGACRRSGPADGPDPSEEVVAVADGDAEAERERAAREVEAEARAERERRERELVDARALLERIVHFDYDSERLTPEAQEILRRKAELLRANPNLRIRVEGHTDERGSTEYNLALGQRRAESIRSFLRNHGVSDRQISTLSYGKERPRVRGSNEEAWAENRRGEFVVTGGEVDTIPPSVR